MNYTKFCIKTKEQAFEKPRYNKLQKIDEEKTTNINYSNKNNFDIKDTSFNKNYFNEKHITPIPLSVHSYDFPTIETVPLNPRFPKKISKKSPRISMILFMICLSVCIAFGGMLFQAYINNIYAPEFICNLISRLSYASSGADFEVRMQMPVLYSFEKSNNFYTNQNKESNFNLPLITEPLKKHPNPIPYSNTNETVGEYLSENAILYPLKKADLSRGGDKVYINNETSFSVDIESLSEKSVAVFADLSGQSLQYTMSDDPIVLVLHTHGTESYQPTDGDYYDYDNYSARSEDTEKNIVRVGTELADILNSYGISTLHCPIMHDKDSFVTAYKNSLNTVNDYLSQYPSIKYVIDVHRDSIEKEEKEKVKTYTVIGNEPTAQVMLVVGTSGAGASHPNWENNLQLAIQLQEVMNDDFPTLARPINLRNSRFNQHVCDGAFILEVGSCGNTLDEALSAIRLFAQSFSKTLYQG